MGGRILSPNSRRPLAALGFYIASAQAPLVAEPDRRRAAKGRVECILAVVTAMPRHGRAEGVGVLFVLGP